MRPLHLIRKAITALADFWREGGRPETCHLCHCPLGPEEVVVCEACVTASAEEIVRERIAELDLCELLGMARGLAMRQGHRELAAALHAVLLLHMSGGSLGAVAALAVPPPGREAVN